MKCAIVCTVLFSTTTVKAQLWHFGPKLDINYSSISGNGIKKSFSPGYQAGAFAEIIFNKHWSIQPEVLYSWSRYKEGDDFLTYYVNEGRTGANENIKLGSISVPLLARYNVNKVFSILAGPQYDHLLYDDEDLLKYNKQAFKDDEISADLGVQVNLENVGFYARYTRGLSDINGIDDRYSWTTNHIQIGIAVQIK
jgi:hypothetical protein